LVQIESVEQVQEVVLPMFDNSKFVALTSGFKSAIQMLQSHLSPVATRLMNGDKSTQSEASTALEVPLSAHPILQFLRASIGVISLHEHRSRQEFYDALSPEILQAVKTEELMRKRKAREMAGSPSGLEELNKAIQVGLLSHSIFNNISISLVTVGHVTSSLEWQPYLASTLSASCERVHICIRPYGGRR
jgi:hypothetical protein